MTPADKRKNTNVLKPAGYRQSVCALLLATLAINILSLALPIMTKQIYNRILPNPDTGTLPVLMTGVCVAVVLEAVLRLCRAWVIGRAGASYEHRMACAAMDRILNADLSKMEQGGIGENLHRMAAVGRVRDFYSGYALTVLAELAFVPVFLGLIIYIAGPLSVVPAGLLTVFIMISLWEGYSLRGALQNRERADDERFNFLIESLEGVHTVKAFALEKFFERRYEALEERSTLANYNVTRETAGTFNMGAIFSHLMVACVISAGAWLVLQGMLTTGALIATLLLAGRMMQPVQKTLALWARYQDYLLARQHVEKLFAVPQQPRRKQAAGKSAAADGRLSLSGVSFRYLSDDESVLEDATLSLEPGDAVHIAGPHGAGKTTLLNMIAGIYPPGAGGIRLDGRDIASFAPEELVRHVGYIRTRPLIFRGTIRDNITCFGQIGEAQAREVAALLRVDRDVARLPAGFDTFLAGNGTDSISHGLKQRIAIVRALALKPRLILFDGADRTLDREGYALIYSLLARLKGKATMILVTDDHNISALATRRFSLQDGRLVPDDVMPGQKSNIHPYTELPL